MNNFDFVADKKLKKQLEFIVTCDKMKQIARRTMLTDKSRQENDAEHSWHLALCAIVLEEYAPEGTDMKRVLEMVTVHDLIEIYAGDTFAYDKAGNATKEKRETEAADRLFGSLDQQGNYLRALWDEFEIKETNEAKFACVLDRIQPLIHNYMTDGYTWRGGDVTSEMVYKRNEICKDFSPVLWNVIEQIVEDSVEKGLLKR